MMRLIKVIFLIVAVFHVIVFNAFSPALAEDTPPEFKIEIKREKVTDQATLGSLSVGGKFVCYTLERLPLNNAKDVSSIPPGIYPGHLRYEGTRGWRIQLENVPDRTNVQIHVGNFPNDSTGCVLVGMTRDEKKPAVGDSKKAIEALKRSFYGKDEPNSSPNVRIVVTITNE